jgi:hypothetical protein
MSELPTESIASNLEARTLDEANDRFSLIRAQEGSAILRRYNASIAAVRAGLEKVPVRHREITTAAVQAYMKVAHDLWKQMAECENSFGRARRLQMDAQMHFAQSTKLFMAQSESTRKGFLKRLFLHHRRPSGRDVSQPVVAADARDLAVESASALRSAVDQQTDALMKHSFLQGEFERTLTEMAQIVQQHMVQGREVAKAVDATTLESISSDSRFNHFARESPPFRAGGIAPPRSGNASQRVNGTVSL